MSNDKVLKEAEPLKPVDLIVSELSALSAVRELIYHLNRYATTLSSALFENAKLRGELAIEKEKASLKIWNEMAAWDLMSARDKVGSEDERTVPYQQVLTPVTDRLRHRIEAGQSALPDMLDMLERFERFSAIHQMEAARLRKVLNKVYGTAGIGKVEEETGHLSRKLKCGPPLPWPEGEFMTDDQIERHKAGLCSVGDCRRKTVLGFHVCTFCGTHGSMLERSILEREVEEYALKNQSSK